MAKKNLLFQNAPFELESALAAFGANLRTARQRRGLSAQKAAEKLGVGVRSVMDAEKGKPTTAVSTYMGLLWAYDLLGDMKGVADPMKDIEGLRLAASREKKSIKSALDNDF
jgi:transcriptional regulator with XRE-family HTH domain